MFSKLGKSLRSAVRSTISNCYFQAGRLETQRVNTGENNQGQCKQHNTGESHQDGNVISDKRKTTRDFTVKQETQDKTVALNTARENVQLARILKKKSI